VITTAFFLYNLQGWLCFIFTVYDTYMKPLNFLVSLFLYTLPLQVRSHNIHSSANYVNGEFYSINSYLSEVKERGRNSDQPPAHLVVYKSFSVQRLRSKVDLVWETSWECNNSGFEIQRKTGDGEWQKVAFVFSQALHGNSNTLLTYEFTDVNTSKVKSQYRLRLVDKDQSAAFSEERNVRGY